MACNTTASKKAKGRHLQQLVRDALRLIGKSFGLEDGDLVSTSMGASGVDVQLSPSAKKVFGRLAIEAKNNESLNVVTTFWNHAGKYPSDIALLFSKKNHTEPLVTMTMKTFMELLNRSLHAPTS